MGRPLNKKYFANTNYSNQKVGGEGVVSVTVAGEFSGFTAETTTVTFSAPQVAGGLTTVGTAVINGSGVITAITIVDSGSGYTSVPTVAVADSDAGGEVTTGTLTAVLSTTARTNGIICQAITVGSTNRTSGNDIIKQLGSNHYRVQTQDGIAECTLTASAPTVAGQMAIVATDSVGGTYFVTKLTAHKATITRGTGVSFASGTQVKWTLDAAVLDVSVSIPNV
jgi:hypothetical protein